MCCEKKYSNSTLNNNKKDKEKRKKPKLKDIYQIFSKILTLRIKFGAQLSSFLS